MKAFWKYKLDHVVFWAVTVIFYAFIKRDLLREAGVYYYVTDIVLRNALLAFICYLNLLYFMPRYLKKGKYVRYAVSILFCLLLYTFPKDMQDNWLYGSIPGKAPAESLFSYTYYNFSNALFYLAFTVTLELSKQWFHQQRVLHEVQVENLETELRYLKAQLNPHFLFNAINSIYFQIDKHNQEARGSLVKFSEMLRYQLYDCNEDLIPIEKEIDYLASYVDLQRLRKQENSQICFRADDNVRDFFIAPLLLIPFVENAFKHVSNTPDRPNEICLHLYRQDEYLVLEASNSKNDVAGSEPGEGGIGLKNVRRRLELLYPDNYQLQVDNNCTAYSVNLKLKVR